MAITRPQSISKQRKQGWMIVAVVFAGGIAQATGLWDWLLNL